MILKFLRGYKESSKIAQKPVFFGAVSDELKLIHERRKSDDETTVEQLGQLTAMLL